MNSSPTINMKSKSTLSNRLIILSDNSINENNTNDTNNDNLKNNIYNLTISSAS